MKTRTQLLTTICLTLLCGVTNVFAADPQPAQDSAADERPARRKLVLAKPPSTAETAAKEKVTRDQTLRTLEMLGALNEFQCRLSEDCLARPISKPVGIDAAFQDVVIGVPVYGQARVDGALKIELTPDKEHVSFDVVFAGTVALKGTGRSQDVQIRTDTLVDFTASKRIQLDHQGVTSTPTVCKAKAAITTKEISSSRPRILGKFSEKIAQRKTVTSKEEAEAECAEHLADAISEHMDQEVSAVADVVNAALADYLKAATEQARARWTEVRFNTADDWVHVARAGAGKELPEFKAALPDKAASPLVLQLPRARLDVNVVLTGMRYLQKDGQQPAASSHVAVRQPVKFRPVVELGSETITFRFEFDEPAKLAQDAPVAQAQTQAMP